MKNGPYELVIAPEGYPGKKYRGRYCYEYTLTWWKNTGKIPSQGYEIHHLDTNHRNNDFSNLTLLTSEEHKRIHADMRISAAIIKMECGNCKEVFSITGSKGRHRLKKSKYGKIFCSKSCGAIHQFSN